MGRCSGQSRSRNVLADRKKRPIASFKDCAGQREQSSAATPVDRTLRGHRVEVPRPWAFPKFALYSSISPHALPPGLGGFMSSNDETVQQQIAALRVAYVQQLPQRLNEAREAFEAWSLSRAGSDLFTFYRLTHNLAGSGAVYGYKEVTEKARAVEQTVTPFIEKKAAARPQDIVVVRERLDILEQTLLRIAAELRTNSSAESP